MARETKTITVTYTYDNDEPVTHRAFGLGDDFVARYIMLSTDLETLDKFGRNYAEALSNMFAQGKITGNALMFLACIGLMAPARELFAEPKDIKKVIAVKDSDLSPGTIAELEKAAKRQGRRSAPPKAKKPIEEPALPPGVASFINSIAEKGGNRA